MIRDRGRILALLCLIGAMALVMLGSWAARHARADGGPAPVFAPALREVLVVPGVARDIPPVTDAELQAQKFAAETETLAIAAVARAREGERLTVREVEALFAYVGVPPAWRADLLAIMQCESGHQDADGVWWLNPRAIGDGGNSWGLGQLWFGWLARFAAGGDLLNPITNVWVAIQIREVRGRWGGPGGWTCADLRGIW